MSSKDEQELINRVQNAIQQLAPHLIDQSEAIIAWMSSAQSASRTPWFAVVRGRLRLGFDRKRSR